MSFKHPAANRKKTFQVTVGMVLLLILVAAELLTKLSKSAEESFGKTPYAVPALYPLGTYKYFNAIFYDVSAANSASDNTSLNTATCLTYPSI